jgi:ABC-2 type transport system permease protein
MQWKRYAQTVLAGALGLSLLVGLNVLAAKQNWRWDTTVAKRNSLAPETIQVLQNLDRQVAAVAFYRPEEGKQQLEDLFNLFKRHTDLFSYEFVDPDRSPFRARELQVTTTGSVVLLSGDKQEQLALPDEERLLNGLIRVSSQHRATLYFSTGHGEVDPAGEDNNACTHLAGVLTEQGANVEKLTLVREESVPNDADVLFILGPRTDFAPQELELLNDYLERGGRLFIALAAEHETNLDDWLPIIGLERLNGYVVDPLSKLLVGDPMAPIVQDYAPHPITESFNLMTVFPTATALGAFVAGDGPELVQWLGRSTPQSWLETDTQALRAGSAEFAADSDIEGPLWIAAMYEKRMPRAMAGEEEGDVPLARAVVFADQDFFTDQFVNTYGNMDLARNSANWLMEREALITVTKPKAANVFLMLSLGERMLVSWVPLLVVPGACLFLAVIIALMRRKVK